MTNAMRVFLSRPSWIAPRFRAGIERFQQRLLELGLDARTLGVSTAADQNPVRDVVRLVDNTYGMVVLGWPQIEAPAARIKETDAAPLILPTEWNHIESAIAFARGRPLILLRERSVAGRGMLDAASLGLFVREVDGEHETWVDEPLVLQALRTWRDKVGDCRQRTISLDGLRVLRVLGGLPPRKALGSARIRTSIPGLDAPRLRRVLNKLIAHELVDANDYDNAAADYYITQRGRVFLEGFQMGAPQNHL